MASIDLIKASNGSGNAAVATVQSTRLPGATTIDVDSVANINDYFAGTMGTPHTFVDPITAETITVISEDSAVDFFGHVDGSNLEIDTIAPGYTDAGSAVDDIVVIRPTTQWADNVASVLEVAHEDNGKLKAAIPVYGNAAYTFEPLTGWITDPNTFTYVSGTGTTTAVFKVTGVDVTDHLQAGMPFVAVQGGVSKYGFITKVAFSTDTTITAFMSATSGTVDNSGITNTTITSFKFGLPKRPGFGFPLDPARWTITTTSSNDRSTTSTSYATLTDSISLPIGSWHLSIQAFCRLSDSSASGRSGEVALSTSTSSATNDNLRMGLSLTSGVAATWRSGYNLSAFDNVTTTTTTTYTMIGITVNSPTLTVLGAANPTIIRATCNYL